MATLKTELLKAQIEALQKKLQLAEKSKKPAIRKVQSLMKKLGITIADLQGRNIPSVKKTRTGKRGPAPIKYKDKAGNQWSGRGKTPRWIVAAEKAGKRRDSFLV